MIEPVNFPISDEFIVRNVYCTSQYSSRTGLKKNYLYPNYLKESRYYKGYHQCRVSVQRVCFGGWNGVTASALKTKSDSQELVGFSLASSDIVCQQGFILEPAAHEHNPFHAHILIPELNLPFPTEGIASVFSPGVRRRLDEITSKFRFFSMEELPGETSSCFPKDFCARCLDR